MLSKVSIYIDTKEESEKIQKLLFSYGYTWRGGDIKIQDYINCYINLHKDMLLGYGHCYYSEISYNGIISEIRKSKISIFFNAAN
jgi:hypothetical protein